MWLRTTGGPMHTQFLTSRPHRRGRAVVLVVAAATIPAFLSIRRLRASSRVPPRDGVSATLPAAGLSGSAGDRGDLVCSSYVGGREWDEGAGVSTDRDG